jgi:hypothetical protein
LNHPNIAHIHSLEESNGVRALLQTEGDSECASITGITNWQATLKH